MESHRNSASTVGFSLLPSELIQCIFLRLSLPDIFPLRSVSKSIGSMFSDQDFVRNYNLHSSIATWLFIYKKRWHRDTVLYGVTDCSNRWFKILSAQLLKSIVPPSEDLYFLTASGNFFLFALNGSQEMISVNPVTKMVKKIPPSPLGRRGTSSWRRSGMKLLSGPPGSCHFRFLFTELHENNPILFEYDSETDKWQSINARENNGDLSCGNKNGRDCIFLSAYNGWNESVIIVVGNSGTPVVVRPRFDGGWNEEGRLAVGFSWGNAIDQLHVYGDGNMMIVRSDGVDDGNKKVRTLKGVEIWSLSSNGRRWEPISKVTREIIDEIKRPYGVMMGCLDERDGIIRAILMSNLEGVWDMIWLSYDNESRQWSWAPLPDCKMKGSNMAGISFSSGLTLS